MIDSNSNDVVNDNDDIDIICKKCIQVVVVVVVVVMLLENFM